MSKKAELIGNYYGTIYLTVISLLQGIALSQLVPAFLNYIEIAEHPFTDIHLVPILLVLLIIFVVWHHYAIGIFFLRWFPNIIDTLIPFMVSLGQFFLISYLTIKTSVTDMDIKSWTIGFSIFLILGSLAYFSAAFRLDAEMFTNIMTKQNAIGHCERSKKFYKWAGISILFQGLFAFVMALLQNDTLLVISLVFFLLHLILSEYFLLTNVKPLFIKAMDEFADV